MAWNAFFGEYTCTEEIQHGRCFLWFHAGNQMGAEGIELPEPTFASISKRTWYLKKDSPDFFGVHNNFRISFEQELGHRCIIELKHILSTPMKKM